MSGEWPEHSLRNRSHIKDIMRSLLGTRRATAAATALAGVASGLLLTGLTVVPAQAATTDAGLFGSTDPTYDGVYRQSLALIGLEHAGAKLPASAIAWLKGQQCADGTFVAYRATTATACPAADPVNFTGPDTNSTALASMALAAAGQKPAADKAARALVAKQNADGGWGYVIGSPSDANSTGLVLAALDHSSGAETAAERKGRRYLASIAGACKAGSSGLPFQDGQAHNSLASAQALLGLNTGLPMTDSKAKHTASARCNEALDQRVAEYLAGELAKGKGVLESSMTPGQPDYNTTAWTIAALIGANRPAAEIAPAVKALKAHASEYVGAGAAISPAAAGTLAIIAEDTGASTRDFGGVNLVNAITGTLRK